MNLFQFLIYLMYYFMRNKYKSSTSLLATFIFLASTPLTFHSHRHIMFMSYMPFLLLSLIGVDRYFNKNKKGLLIVSLFLLIMTSYYFSISSIFVIVLYGVYSYLKQNLLKLNSNFTDIEIETQTFPDGEHFDHLFGNMGGFGFRRFVVGQIFK